MNEKPDTSTGEYRITRQNFSEGACLGCISHADLTVSGPEHALAVRIGLPVEALRPHLASSDPLPAALIMATTVTAADKTLVAATPARQLLERFCGSLQLDDGPAVSAPMISAAAGVLLAGELIKTGAHPRPALGPGDSIFASALRGRSSSPTRSSSRRRACAAGSNSPKGPAPGLGRPT